jgi:hypothetical protein
MGRQPLKIASDPANPAGPANKTTRGGPTALPSFFSWLLSLTAGAQRSVSFPSFLLHPLFSSQPPTPPRRAAQRPARGMGWLGVSWPARRGLACARDQFRGIRQGEKTPLPSLGDAKVARPPLMWLHVGRCAMATNRSAPAFFTPVPP